MEARSLLYCFGVFWRAVIVGIGYLAALIVAGGIMSAAGIAMPEAGNVRTILPLSLLAGTLTGLVLGPIAQKMPASRLRHIIVWASVLFFNGAALAIEASFFIEKMRSAAPALVIQHLATAVVTAGLIALLFAPSGKLQQTVSFPKRAWRQWLERFIISSLSYLVFYYLFGELNYAFVTRPYYESHVAGLTVPGAQVVFLRAPLMVLSIVPLILTMRIAKGRLAGICGIILFMVGGAIPLALATELPMFLRVASAWEIFFQNFLTGAVAALLLGPGLQNASSAEDSQIA
jgi:hypothetical protein